MHVERKKTTWVGLSVLVLCGLAFTTFSQRPKTTLACEIHVVLPPG
jgi:hypothetical protein